MTTTIENNNQEQEDPVKTHLSKIELITVLSDLANAVRDPEVEKALLARPNGARLYELFAAAVSNEIERLMSPEKAVPKVIRNAAEAAGQILDRMNHLGYIFAAIEQGPGMQFLRLFLQTLGTQLPELPSLQRMAGSQPAPAPQQSAASRPQQQNQQSQQQYYNTNQPRGGSGAGSW